MKLITGIAFQPLLLQVRRPLLGTVSLQKGDLFIIVWKSNTYIKAIRIGRNGKSGGDSGPLVLG